MLKRTTKPLRRRILIEEGLAKSSKKQHSENTDKWHLWKACSWNANQNKTTRRAGYKKVYEPPPSPPHPKEAFRIKGALWNAEQSKNTNNNSYRQKKAKEKALKWTSQTEKRSPTKTTLRRTAPYKMLKRTTKPQRRRVLVEEGQAKSSEKQHLENTDKWHLCRAGSFTYGESPRTPPLEGTSLHRWNISVKRP